MKKSSYEVFGPNQEQFLLNLDGGKGKQNGTQPPHIHKPQQSYLCKNKIKILHEVVSFIFFQETT